ncbi:MAG TPA: sulfotransferase family protein [Pseudolabrys sp.]
MQRVSSRIVNLHDRWLDPPALSFFQTISDAGFDPDAHIDVLPRHRLIYFCVPKCASTTIKSALSALELGRAPPPDKLHTRRYSGIKSPTQIGLSAFHQLANNRATLRFAFVHNPYARLVSAWADKFQDKPLVPGDSFVDLYLMHRVAIDGALPKGPDQTLSFSQFVDFAAASSNGRVNAHWQAQDDLLNLPGINLNLIGKVESFRKDFAYVLDHVGADRQIRQALSVNHNVSRHRPWPHYYTDALAARVHRAYERDFDRFGYARAIKETALA